MRHINYYRATISFINRKYLFFLRISRIKLNKKMRKIMIENRVDHDYGSKRRYQRRSKNLTF